MIPWRELPAALYGLRDLALDLRWTWSHEADELWAKADGEMWRLTHNPWTILEELSTERLNALAADADFVASLGTLLAARKAYLEDRGWFSEIGGDKSLPGVAYFSMEFGLGEALPLYAGGLGILAGDFLKSASDLGLPVVGVGLLYQEGYFRQMIDAAGWQHEAYPFNDPASMPIEPARTKDGAWLHIPVELPGRTLYLRVWRVRVGRTLLYLLDTNDPVNGPVDRGIAGKLYGGGSEMRLLQELVLGVGGWRLIEAMHPEIPVCHLNEGHAAFAVLERARTFSRRSGLTFEEAIWATRAGNVFTTHTAVAAAFDRFPRDLLTRYGQAWAAGDAGSGLGALGSIGQATDADAPDVFNMAFLAARGALLSFGVSRLHGAVSRRIFQPLYPRWPEQEVPFGHVTNGVHVPTWDSAQADALWTEACGKNRWRHETGGMGAKILPMDDAALWALRGDARQALVGNVRRRLSAHLSGRGHPPEVVSVSDTVLDPNVLTLGFARRFTAYKRPDLLLRDPGRLGRLLSDDAHPAQLVIAGKAHPDDEDGKQMIQAWIAFAQDPRYRRRIVFLEDYDIALALELVQGIDVWINTPRRPWEACGTSGMKVLVNGGLNLSTLDGWWQEAFTPEVGWAIGRNRQPNEDEQDRLDAEELYSVLEQQVVPAFYDRDASGVPRAWVDRMRRSMAELTTQYSASRMVRDYLEKAYFPAAKALKERVANNGARAKEMAVRDRHMRRDWGNVHIGESAFTQIETGWDVSVPVYLGAIDASDIRVEACIQQDDGSSVLYELARGEPVPGAAAGYFYRGRLNGNRPAADYTVRVIPSLPGVRVPAEITLIRWQR
jgi:starch phosphorylase